MRWLWTLVFVLSATIVVMVLFWPPPPPVNREVELKARIDSLVDVNRSILNDHKKDSLEASKKITAANREIKALKATRAKVIREIDTVILKDPEFQRYVAVTDSIILKQDDHINFLDDALGREQTRFGQLQTNFDKSIETFQAQHAADSELITQLQKQNRRLRIGNRLLKVAITVGVVAGVYAGSRID